MSSQGPYGRQGFSSQAAGYEQTQSGGYYGGGSGGAGAPGGAAQPPQGGQGYGYGNASYAAPSPMGGYPPAQEQYGAPPPGVNAKNDDEKDKTGKKSNALKAINNSVIMWAAFFAVSLMCYLLISSSDFSFIMTYGSLSRMFGFGILNVKTFKTGKATGVSTKTLSLYCIVFACRLTSIVRHEGYLPYDKSGDWLYHVIEFMALAFTASALYGCLVPFKGSYQADFDKFGEMHVPPGFGAIYLVVPCLIVAILIHPGLNQDFLSDVSWTFAMYLESVALVPQLYMFQKQASGVVELLTAHFVAALGFGRVLEFVFWLYSYHELAHKSGSNMAGYLALFAQFAQIVLMLDFFWYYYQAVKNATPLVLPSHSGLGVV